MPLAPGDPAPEISAPNQHGETVAPDRDGPTVLFFYPEDGTPGCEIEAEQFVLEAGTYDDAGVTVYGVSVDEVDSHREFADRKDIAFDLLADPDGEILDAYGVERDHSERARRTTFVVVDGAVHRVYENVNPDGHAREVLTDLFDEGVVELDL